jgi:hypothetical protein
MKRIVLIFGLISGAISSAMMFATVPFMENSSFDPDRGEIIGYTAIFLSFLLVFFGIRSYRENNGGTVTFGRAFSVGILITLISCVFYVASWEIIYYNFIPDFADKYAVRKVASMRQKGASAAAIAKTQKEMASLKELYSNPLINVGMTFIEPFPVGLLMTLLSAGILRKRSSTPSSPVAAAVA